MGAMIEYTNSPGYPRLIDTMELMMSQLSVYVYHDHERYFSYEPAPMAAMTKLGRPKNKSSMHMNTAQVIRLHLALKPQQREPGAGQQQYPYWQH